MKTMTFHVTRRVQVAIDEAKFSQELMQRFNAYISDFGTGEAAFVEHGEHIARLAGTGFEDFLPTDFVEGYGRVSDAGIVVQIMHDHDFVERVFPEEARS